MMGTQFIINLLIVLMYIVILQLFLLKFMQYDVNIALMVVLSILLLLLVMYALVNRKQVSSFLGIEKYMSLSADLDPSEYLNKAGDGKGHNFNLLANDYVNNSETVKAKQSIEIIASNANENSYYAFELGDNAVPKTPNDLKTLNDVESKALIKRIDPRQYDTQGQIENETVEAFDEVQNKKNQKTPSLVTDYHMNMSIEDQYKALKEEGCKTKYDNDIASQNAIRSGVFTECDLKDLDCQITCNKSSTPETIGQGGIIASDLMSYRTGLYAKDITDWIEGDSALLKETEVYTTFTNQLEPSQNTQMFYDIKANDRDQYLTNVENNLDLSKPTMWYLDADKTECKPECCPGFYTCSTGCMCLSKEQSDLINSRSNKHNILR